MFFTKRSNEPSFCGFYGFALESVILERREKVSIGARTIVDLYSLVFVVQVEFVDLVLSIIDSLFLM